MSTVYITCYVGNVLSNDRNDHVPYDKRIHLG